jgi:hypothetical protein
VARLQQTSDRMAAVLCKTRRKEDAINGFSRHDDAFPHSAGVH